jgi:hypothetical protein
MKTWNEIVSEANMKNLFSDIESNYNFAKDFQKNVTFKDFDDRLIRTKKNKKINDFIESVMQSAKSKHSYEEIIKDFLMPDAFNKTFDDFLRGLRL